MEIKSEGPMSILGRRAARQARRSESAQGSSDNDGERETGD